jgi:hypothetical protein
MGKKKPDSKTKSHLRPVKIIGSDMDQLPPHPHLYEINTRVWLNSLSDQYGRKLTLGSIPQENWDRRITAVAGFFKIPLPCTCKENHCGPLKK